MCDQIYRQKLHRNWLYRLCIVEGETDTVLMLALNARTLEIGVRACEEKGDEADSQDCQPNDSMELGKMNRSFGKLFVMI